MQEFIKKLTDNPRIIVGALITAGIVALAFGGSDTADNVDVGVTQDQGISLTSDSIDEALTTENDGEAASDEVVIGSTPSAGPVEVNKEDAMYSATVRSGDNQTVVARQMVNNYLSDRSQSLSAEQRLYVETVIVDSLPRNNVIYPGDVIQVEDTVIADAVTMSGDLTESQLALWATYL